MSNKRKEPSSLHDEYESKERVQLQLYPDFAFNYMKDGHTCEFKTLVKMAAHGEERLNKLGSFIDEGLPGTPEKVSAFIYMFVSCNSSAF